MRGRGNKYGARKTACNHGHTHDSGKEARRCNDLHLLQRAGEIEDLRVQPQYWFVIDGRQVKHGNGRRVGFKPDFAYIECKSGADVVEDAKSDPTKTEAYVLRATIFRALFPTIDFREV